MTRKEWLETILKLADANAPAIEYRKHLRIMNRDLSTHVRKIHEYREELKAILSKEQAERERKAAARERTVESRLPIAGDTNSRPRKSKKSKDSSSEDNE